jgi:hypothetical protein
MSRQLWQQTLCITLEFSRYCACLEVCVAITLQSGMPDLEAQLALEQGHAHDAVQLARAENFLTTSLEMIAQRAWQQSEHSSTLPGLWHTVFHKDLDQRVSGMAKAKQVWTVVLKAVATRQSGAAGRALVGKVLDNLYFAEACLVKEYALCAQRCDWSPDGPAFREAMWKICGTISNTKFVLEDGFGRCRDQRR